MNWLYPVSSVVAIGLLAYLVYALIKAEEF
jgi:K+-transporting ATPase KdpF subunit